MNFSRNDRMWHFASSDLAYSKLLASAEKVGLAIFALVWASIAMEPILMEMYGGDRLRR